MSLGLVYFDWVCLQGSLYISDCIMELTLPCPGILSIRFYATRYLEGKPKTQHLRAFFLGRGTHPVAEGSPPKISDFHELLHKYLTFYEPHPTLGLFYVVS